MLYRKTLHSQPAAGTPDVTDWSDDMAMGEGWILPQQWFFNTSSGLLEPKVMILLI